MSLRDELPPAGIGGGQCHTCTWLFAQPVADQAEWLELFEDRSVPHSSLFILAQRHKLGVGPTALRRHREQHTGWGTL